MKRIGIDLGGTKTEIILTQENVLNVIKRKRVATNRDKGYAWIVELVANLINGYKPLIDEEYVIGMAIPGSIAPQTGLVQSANTTVLIGHPLKQDLEALVDHEVLLENDANCFALSEAILGAGQGKEMVLGIIMGTGMGGGIVHKGRIWRGIHNNAGEWGHTCLDFEGPECWCGQKGCMELYLSGIGVQRIYQEYTGKRKSLQEIYRNYEAGKDQHAQKTITDFVHYFGRCMANLINIFDPNILVIGGGVSNLPILYKAGQESTNRQLFNTKLPVPIVKNKLGDSSGIYGAAILAG
ncbi:MAG: ROK family protein [SAR324 cluster bacterium]|nr:ROK family protein [SAR324 cluster bacterium]